MRIEDFDYNLPAAAIAQRPAEIRDHARLLVVEPRIDTTFARLGDHLREGDLLVINDSRVRAARLVGRRPTGGRVELLLLGSRSEGWDALARPSRKISPGDRLEFPGVTAVVDQVKSEGRVVVMLEHEFGDDEKAIDEAGRVPYPPYIEEGPEDPELYQTVYAAGVGSAAAPTAGLHFTSRLMGELTEAGVRFASIRLEIGLDTFRPIATGRIEDHVMHAERFSIPEESVAAISGARAAGSRVIAVGTTVVRTLESAAGEDGMVVPGEDSTALFIRPGYVPRIVDGVLTNFHLPRSSLIVMIAALYPAWRAAYEEALARGYRFLSFGDAMFIPSVR